MTIISQEELDTGSWRFIEPMALVNGKTLESISEAEKLRIVEDSAERYRNGGMQIDGEIVLGPTPQIIPSVVRDLGPITMIGIFEKVEPKKVRSFPLRIILRAFHSAEQ